MRVRAWVGWLFCSAVLVIGLASCGGSGGDDGNGVDPATENRWNELTWNTGQWGP
jgi:hypothetical protein